MRLLQFALQQRKRFSRIFWERWISHNCRTNLSFLEEPCSYIKKEVESNILETEEKNLYFLPSGSIPSNPSELIGSPKTSYLFKLLKNKFDMVIVDSPPIISASDALLLAPQVDGVVFVIQAGETPRALVKDAAQQLNNTKTNVLGVVLNQANMSKDSYYKKHYYSY